MGLLIERYEVLDELYLVVSAAVSKSPADQTSYPVVPAAYFTVPPIKQLHDRRAGRPLGFHGRIARAAAGSFRTLARAIRHKEQDLTIGPEQYAQICIREKAAARAAARQQERLAREVSQTPAAAALSSVNSGDPFAELLALPSQAELDFQQFISCESPLF